MDVGVYIIENTVNGCRYVGSAARLASREREHFRALRRGRHHSIYLQRAWNKYGEAAFRFSTALYCDKHNLIAYEQTLMDGLSPEYNIAQKAGSQLGYTHTQETRQKMSVARRRNPSSPRKGMTHTEEAKKKISESRMGKGGGPRTPERLAKISAALRGRLVPQEVRKKISDSLRGRSTGRGKLTVDQVLEIRKLVADGMPVPEIARIMNLVRQNVDVVILGKGYRWVE